MPVFAPPSPFYNNGQCVRELQALVAPKPPQGVLVRGQAGLVISKLCQGTHAGSYEYLRLIDFACQTGAAMEALRGVVEDIWHYETAFKGQVRCS